ncbi:hypothetical protein AB832_02605 [Flavobacteriaceae bacterium (ex Bugula neritina AB1)]|nr:hypothetical protein AB832_02605 [Flavobacteriaceae bacterium (ex Bugula neritina AB1)]
MNRTRAWYGGSSPDKTARRYHKIYSSIIPAEITMDKWSKNTPYKFVFFNGGDAYSAPMAKIETFVNNASDGGAIYHLQRDHLGSILNITKQTGSGSNIYGEVWERRHFGAWGTVDAFWSKSGGTTVGARSLLNRGYTGHEHFDGIGLIHMNGRMYNPKLGRFLSPDNYIQNPYNTQNYNRYGYVLNNPLMYTDPTGETTEDPSLGGILGGAIMGSSIVAAKWDDWGIKDWANKAFSNFGSDFSGVFRDSGRWVRKLFGEKPIETVEIQQSFASADPLFTPSPVSPAVFTSNGSSFVHAVARTVFAFQAGVDSSWIGLKNGLVNIVTNPASLFTWEVYQQSIISGLRMTFPSIRLLQDSMERIQAAATGDPAVMAYTLGGQVGNLQIESLSLIPGGRAASGLKAVGKSFGRVFRRNNYAYRSLTAADAASLKAGNGLSAKAPNGSWSLEEHLIRGSSPKAWLNNPWIATSTDINIARSFSSGNGLVRINLSKLPANSMKRGWMELNRSSAGYHYSIWQSEVSIFQSIPQSAIKIIK